MKGIVGKKLGMTQVFDPETGGVTPVTVIQAGPCPVVQVKTSDVDGYDAIQLAFEEVAERKLSKAEVGHLKKAGFAPHRHLVELRGESGLSVGETVTVESFEPGEAIKVSGVSIGKGFAGTIKRHNFRRGPKTHGSHNIRKPGSIGTPIAGGIRLDFEVEAESAAAGAPGNISAIGFISNLSPEQEFGPRDETRILLGLKGEEIIRTLQPEGGAPPVLVQPLRDWRIFLRPHRRPGGWSQLRERRFASFRCVRWARARSIRHCIPVRAG